MKTIHAGGESPVRRWSSPPPSMLASLALCALVMLAPVSGVAQGRYGLSGEAFDIFDRWLHSTCIGDEERAMNEALLRYRTAFAPAFEKAFADGPPKEELAAARAAAEERYADRAKLTTGDYRIEGVSREALARFQNVSGQQYVDDQVQRFATGYRSNAIAGLAIVGGSSSRTLLMRIAARKNDPLALAAAEALKTMRRTQR